MQRRIIFKDSLNFFSAPLATLYNTFELQNFPGILQKPHFPHNFNTKENLHVKLNHLPSLEFYGIEEMRAHERNDFMEYYEANKNQQFNLCSALMEYCINDVRLLRFVFFYI